MAMNLDDILDSVLDDRTKGVPGGTTPFRLRDIADKGWNVLGEDLPFPLMVLKRSALDHNIQTFRDYLDQHGLSFAPHGKTTMAPQLYKEQLDAGAWGITAASVNQVQVMARYGIERVILANQLLGRAHVQAIAGLINSRPALEFYCFVDSVAQLQNMAMHLQDTPAQRPIRLLLEVGVEGGRTGVRTPDEAQAVLDAIAASDPAQVQFAGVAAFEGVVPGLGDDPWKAAAFSACVREIAEAVPAPMLENLQEFILSGGGSSVFDLVAREFSKLNLKVPVRVVLRSGCYLTTDSGAYKSAQDAAHADPDRDWKSQLRPALEAWAYVQSTPEPGLAILTMGKRDIPYDAGLPTPLQRYRPGQGFAPIGEATIFATNDQHAFVRIGADADWQVGDLVMSGISHPCTAFDKWRFIPVINDDYDVINGVLTFF